MRHLNWCPLNTVNRLSPSIRILLVALLAGAARSTQWVLAADPSANPPSYKSYSYVGDRYRDPFVPLIGDGRGASTDDRPPQIQSLVLKGIVQDARGRMALLTSGVTSFILRGGRLYDVQNRQVKKISGVIKAESVVLIGSDRTVRELRINKPVL